MAESTTDSRNRYGRNKITVGDDKVAMCMVAAGPMLVVFPFFQKYFWQRSYGRGQGLINVNILHDAGYITI